MFLPVRCLEDQEILIELSTPARALKILQVFNLIIQVNLIFNSPGNSNLNLRNLIKLFQ